MLQTKLASGNPNIRHCISQHQSGLCYDGWFLSNNGPDIKNRIGPRTDLILAAFWAGRLYACISNILSAGKTLLLRTDWVNEADFFSSFV